MVECERRDAMRSAGSVSPRSGIPAPAGSPGSGIKRPGSEAATMRPKVATPPFVLAPEERPNGRLVQILLPQESLSARATRGACLGGLRTDSYKFISCFREIEESSDERFKE